MLKFQANDIVRLRSGGPSMIVAEADDSTKVVCVWKNNSGDSCSEIIPSRSLRLLARMDGSEALESA